MHTDRTSAQARFGGTFSDNLSIPGTDSDQAYETLHEKFPERSGDAMQVVIRSAGDLREDPTRQAVEVALRDAAAGPDVAGAVSPYQPGGLISADGHAAVAMVWFTERARNIPPESVAAAQHSMTPIRDAGTRVEFGGAAVQGEHGPSGTEAVGLAAAVVVLLFTFGSVFATLVPLLTAVLAIAFGLSMIRLLSAATPIGTAAPVVAAMIGLGVGIDYALLVVTRHREEVSAGRTATGATVVAMCTAGSTVVVAILSLYAILLVEFRSLFVPVKAAVLNLLSIGAAYGAVVAAFQWGWLPGTQPGPVESFAPVMLFAVLFGLSMDYEVFLLSRVRERYLATNDAARAMADGIAGTARVITAAAAVMVVVFASFQLNDQRVVNLFGFGLAVAVALDATIVRLVTVPAAMALAGRAAWWFPHRPDQTPSMSRHPPADSGHQPRRALGDAGTQHTQK